MAQSVLIKKTKISSNGKLCISDPCYIENFDNLENIYLNSTPIPQAESICFNTPKGIFDANIYFEDVVGWGRRVSVVEIIFEKNKPSTKIKPLANLMVDSGQMSFFDLDAAKKHWSFNEEVLAIDFWGRDQKLIAQILSDKYELSSNPRNSTYRFSIEDKKQSEIQEFMDDLLTAIGKQKTSDFVLNHPLYTHELFAVLAPKTKTTYDALCDLENDTHLLGNTPMLKTSTGYGDGLYPVLAMFNEEDIVSLQIDFLV